MKKMSALLVLFLALAAGAQGPPDFTGRWRQQTNSGTQRQLEIDQTGNSLVVKTVVTNAEGTRDLEVKYVIGGPATTYKGLDGDEFHTTTHWEGVALVFDTVENEAGGDISQKATWTLSADHNMLQVERESTKSGKTTRTSSTFARQP